MTTTIKVKGSALPIDSLTVFQLTRFKMSRKPGSSVNVVPGRPGSVVAWHPARLRAGSLELVLADEAQARAFDALISRAQTYTLTDTDRPLYNMDFAVDEGGWTIELDEQTRRRFIATVEVVEQ